MTKNVKTPNLEQVSDDLLYREYERREKIRKDREEADRREAERREAERRSRLAMLIEENFALILALVPEHGRTSCSDGNPINHGRCTRCSLLEIQAGSFFEINDFDFCLEVTRRA